MQSINRKKYKTNKISSKVEFNKAIIRCFEMFGDILVKKYSLELQTMGNFEFDIDMKPGTWIYISRFDERITLKINDSFSNIYFKHSWNQEKEFFVQDGLSTLLNFSVFTFFEYQKMVCKEFKQKINQ